MSMGHGDEAEQEDLWIRPETLAQSPGHPFYQALESVLVSMGFDRFVEGLCAPYYAQGRGRRSIPPGVYFRMLMIGYFERIDSERGIAWRCSDSMSLRQFLRVRLTEKTPDHSTLSRIRSRLPQEVHDAVFAKILEALARDGLVRGKTVGVDATTLEANAALRSIVRRDSGESYQAFLTELAKTSGIETPTREDLARIDRKRAKKGSNKEWVHPHDPDAQIAKMKDGSTHLAHKVEHAVDLETGAVLSATLHGGATGDTQSMLETIGAAEGNLDEIAADPEAAASLHAKPCEEVVADKGYHSNETLLDLAADGHRTYISEPNRGTRRWKNNKEARDAVYGNRRRIKGERGKALLRRRGEFLERPFAHYLDGGGMRRTHLRTHAKILKRLLIHIAAANLALLMRARFGRGTPKQYAEALDHAIFAHIRLLAALCRELVTLDDL